MPEEAGEKINPLYRLRRPSVLLAVVVLKFVSRDTAAPVSSLPVYLNATTIPDLLNHPDNCNSFQDDF
jgi:hypothetical protein